MAKETLYGIFNGDELWKYLNLGDPSFMKMVEKKFRELVDQANRDGYDSTNSQWLNNVWPFSGTTSDIFQTLSEIMTKTETGAVGKYVANDIDQFHHLDNDMGLQNVAHFLAEVLFQIAVHLKGGIYVQNVTTTPPKYEKTI